MQEDLLHFAEKLSDYGSLGPHELKKLELWLSWSILKELIEIKELLSQK